VGSNVVGDNPAVVKHTTVSITTLISTPLDNKPYPIINY